MTEVFSNSFFTCSPSSSCLNGESNCGQQFTTRTLRKLKPGQQSNRSAICLPNQLPNFAPGNKLDVIILEQPAKSIAGHKVEITLAPFSAPIGMAKGDALHLFVGKGQMHNHVRDARSQILYFVRIKPGPVIGSDRRFNADCSIEYDVIRAEQRRHEWRSAKPLLRNSERQFVFAGYSQKRLEQSLALVKRSHVRIKMSRLNAKRPGPRDLSPNLRFHFPDIHMRSCFALQRI